MTDETSDPTDEEIVPRLLQQAIAMHEVLTALLAAGWTERHAIMYLVEMGRPHRG